MLSAFRIFFDRRFFAIVVYVALALVLFILLEPRPRFQLTDDERRSSIHFTPDGRWLVTTVNETTTENEETTVYAAIQLRDLATGNTSRELGKIAGTRPQ